MNDGVRFTGGYGIEFNGRFFEGDAAIKLRNNIGESVRLLAEYGQREVVRRIESRPFPNARSRQPSRRRTGFTAKHVEIHQDPENSFYAKVRLEANLTRPGARSTGQYDATNIPYIIAWVMESGRRGGYHDNSYRIDLWTGRHRMRRIWQHGERQGKQKPIFAWRRTATMMRRQARQVTSDLAKGLD